MNQHLIVLRVSALAAVLCAIGFPFQALIA